MPQDKTEKAQRLSRELHEKIKIPTHQPDLSSRRFTLIQVCQK